AKHPHCCRCRTMTTKTKNNAIIAAWGIPIVIVSIGLFAGPNPHRRIADFPSIEMTPASITTARKLGSRGSDYFELWIRHADGRSFFHRDPEPAPIQELKSRILDGIGLRLVYWPSLERSVLLEVASSRHPNAKYLAFETVMSEYLHRVLVI